MFKKMNKNKKAWAVFLDWLRITYYYEQYCDNKFILKGCCSVQDKTVLYTIPSFFDEKTNLEIENNRNSSELYDWDNEREYELSGDREISLIKACEKAFEVYNEQLEK